MKNIDDEIRKVLSDYGDARYNAGYLQGVWDFLNQLKTTHKLPQEIADELIQK